MYSTFMWHVIDGYLKYKAVSTELGFQLVVSHTQKCLSALDIQSWEAQLKIL